jgi:hypothetical protein
VKPVVSKRSRAGRTIAPSTADDFKRIKGIGPATERRLHNAGIVTFAQLAALSPTGLAELVSGLPAQRVAQRAWLNQARRLASSQARSKPDNSAAATVGRQRYATFTVEMLLDEDNRARRTHVAHVQDGDELIWKGWDGARLIDFLVEHAGLRPQPVETAPPAATLARFGGEAYEPAPPPVAHDERSERRRNGSAEQPAAASATEPQPAIPPAEARVEESPADLRLEVTDMRPVEFPAGEKDKPPFIKRIRMQINFKLSGPAADPMINDRARYFIQVLACEWVTGQTTVLAADHQQLRSDTLSHTITVEFPPPKVGRYQLAGMVLLPDGETVGVTLGPILIIVP